MHPEEVALKATIVNVAREVVARVHSTKWNQVAVASFCTPAQLTTIITDKQAPVKMVQDVRALGIQVHLV